MKLTYLTEDDSNECASVDITTSEINSNEPLSLSALREIDENIVTMSVLKKMDHTKRREPVEDSTSDCEEENSPSPVINDLVDNFNKCNIKPGSHKNDEVLTETLSHLNLESDSSVDNEDCVCPEGYRTIPEVILKDEADRLERENAEDKTIREKGPYGGQPANYLPTMQNHNHIAAKSYPVPANGVTMANYNSYNTSPYNNNNIQNNPLSVPVYEQQYQQQQQQQHCFGKRRSDFEEEPLKYVKPYNNLSNPPITIVAKNKFSGGKVLTKSPEEQQLPFFPPYEITTSGEYDILHLLGDTLKDNISPCNQPYTNQTEENNFFTEAAALGNEFNETLLDFNKLQQTGRQPMEEKQRSLDGDSDGYGSDAASPFNESQGSPAYQTMYPSPASVDSGTGSSVTSSPRPHVDIGSPRSNMTGFDSNLDIYKHSANCPSPQSPPKEFTQNMIYQPNIDNSTYQTQIPNNATPTTTNSSYAQPCNSNLNSTDVFFAHHITELKDVMDILGADLKLTENKKQKPQELHQNMVALKQSSLPTTRKDTSAVSAPQIPGNIFTVPSASTATTVPPLIASQSTNVFSVSSANAAFTMPPSTTTFTMAPAPSTFLGSPVTPAFIGSPVNSTFTGSSVNSTFTGTPVNSTFTGSPVNSTFTGSPVNSTFSRTPVTASLGTAPFPSASTTTVFTAPPVTTAPTILVRNLHSSGGQPVTSVVSSQCISQKSTPSQIIVFPSQQSGPRSTTIVLVQPQQTNTKKGLTFKPIRPKLPSKDGVDGKATAAVKVPTPPSRTMQPVGRVPPTTQPGPNNRTAIPALRNTVKQLNVARRVVANMTKDDLQKVDMDGDTYLHVAVCRVDRYILEALLERIVREKLQHMVYQQNHDKQTPLYLAVGANQPEMVELLIKYGGNSGGVNLMAEQVGPNCQKKFCAALHSATSRGHQFLLTLKALLRSPDCNLSIPNSEGHTALHCAILEHGQLLESDNSKMKDSRPIIEALINVGADPNAQDMRSGKTAFMYALETCDQKLMETLLKLIDPAKIQSYFRTQAFDGNTSIKILESRKKDIDASLYDKLMGMSNNRAAASHRKTTGHDLKSA